jgi:hypothetical protein
MMQVRNSNGKQGSSGSGSSFYPTKGSRKVVGGLVGAAAGGKTGAMIGGNVGKIFGIQGVAVGGLVGGVAGALIGAFGFGD